MVIKYFCQKRFQPFYEHFQTSHKGISNWEKEMMRPSNLKVPFFLLVFQVLNPEGGKACWWSWSRQSCSIGYLFTRAHNWWGHYCINTNGPLIWIGCGAMISWAQAATVHELYGIRVASGSHGFCNFCSVVWTTQ